MTPTIVFDSYWRFAAERQSVFHRRLLDPLGPWTADPILRNFRFTNAYRAADRVSQYLIREIQYRPDRPQNPIELFFRTLLFKVFNRIETWEAVEGALGPLVWARVDLNRIAQALERLLDKGYRIYSSAYIMPSPQFGFRRKHRNHIALLAKMMGDRVPERISRARSLAGVYEIILRYPGLGKFLAFQYTIDLNYSEMLQFDEAEFVVAGPGALDGIAKCFLETGNATSEDVIYWVADRQEVEFRRLGLQFQDLFGRPLQPIDCQNLFCEISKYARVAHPEMRGNSGRVRIKRVYQPGRPLPPLAFPPRWDLNLPPHLVAASEKPVQAQLL